MLALHPLSLTLALLGAFGLLLVQYTLAGERWLPRGEIRRWALLGLVLLVTAALVGGSGYLPGWVAALAAALAMGSGVAALVLALLHFLRQPVHHGRLAAGFVAFAGLALVGALALGPAPRIALTAFGFAALLAPLAVSVQRHGWKAERALRPVVLLLWLAVAMGLLRGVQALTWPEAFDGGFETPMPWPFVLPLLVGLLALLGVAFGYVLAAQERAHNRLKRLASRDALTGLVNRRQYESRRARALAALRRSADPLGLALLDIDDFKRINDTHGHDVGDAALRHLAQVLKPRLRRVDTLARWGGEEFALLLPATPAVGVLQLVRDLRAALKAHPLRLADGQELVLTLSIGWLSLRGGQPPPSTERLMRSLDMALYDVKHAGKDGEREALLHEPGEEPDSLLMIELPDSDHAKL